MLEAQTWRHQNPVLIDFSPLEMLGSHIAAQNVLLVTTPGSVERGVVRRVSEILRNRKIIVWDGVRSYPDLNDLDAATHRLCRMNIGCIVGLGGGSALDSAKILSVTIPKSHNLTLSNVFRDQASVQWSSKIPLVTIPTTSGSGAEVTPFATIWDHEKLFKYSLSGNFIFPDVALLDASLTLTLSEDDSLYPALDTISHALESLWNKNSTPITRIFSFNALMLSSQHLPIVLDTPNNLNARHGLLMASNFAGIAISQTRTAIAHALSYPLTMHCGVPHGLASAMPLLGILNVEFDNLARLTSESITLNKIVTILEKVNLNCRIRKYIEGVDIPALFTSIDESRSDNYFGNSFSITNNFIKQLQKLC